MGVPYRFDSQGGFLGRVEADGRIEPRIVSNDTVWAVVTGDHGESYVARYLLR